MKITRKISVMILILSMGYLSGFGLFADSSILARVGLVLVFLAGSAGVGALIPKRWQLSALCSWGAFLLIIPEVIFRIGRDPSAGQQSIVQVLFIGLAAFGLALFGGYLGYRAQKQFSF